MQFLINFMTYKCQCGSRNLMPAPWSVLFDKNLKCDSCGKKIYTVKKDNSDNDVIESVSWDSSDDIHADTD